METTTLPMLRATLVLATCLALPISVSAQSRSGTHVDGERKPGTYLKAGLANGQGDLFSGSSLTQWDVSLFGTDYDLVSAKVEIETYFPDTFLQLSGFSLGYRKDGLQRAEWGHLLHGTLFRDFDLQAFALKIGGGIEWGIPSLEFDQTEFGFDGDGTTRYRHTYIHRNADIPLFGTRTDGAVYPFGEISVVQRPWLLLFEAGMRVNIIKFNFDDFEVGPTDQLIHASSRKPVLVPYLFADVGIRLF